MDSLDTMPINDVIELYYEKHHALREGNMEKLIELKNKYPDLFKKEKDSEISDIIQYAIEFKKTPRYQELHQIMMKEKLTLIKNDDLFKK